MTASKERAPLLIGRFLVPALLVAAAATGLLAQGKLKMGTLAKPGPAMWPSVTSVLVLLAAAALLAFDRERPETSSGRGRTALLAIASLLVFVGLFWVAGFLPAAIVMLIVWLRLFARQRWLPALVAGVLGAVSCWLIFSVLLGVPFPNPLLLGGE